MQEAGSSRAKEASGGDDRTMVLKFQSVGAKSTTEVLVKSYKPLAQGLEIYGKEEGKQTSRLKLVFDGEVLDTNLSPLDLSLEDGDIVDVR